MSEAGSMQSEIVRLQVQVEGLTKEVYSLRNDVQKSQAPGLVTMQTKLDHFQGKLEEIAADVKAAGNRKTDWKALISVIVAICGLLGSAGFGVYNSVNARIETKLDIKVFEEWRKAEEKRLGIEQEQRTRELRAKR